MKKAMIAILILVVLGIGSILFIGTNLLSRQRRLDDSGWRTERTNDPGIYGGVEKRPNRVDQDNRFVIDMGRLVETCR